MEVWVVYLCLIFIIIVLVLMKQKSHVEEARKERESKLSPPSSSFFPSNVGRQLEHTQEELDKYLERLNHVLFDTEARKRDGHHDQKLHHHEKTTPPGNTENTAEEIEEAVQETAVTDLDERRHQRQPASRRNRERCRPEAAVQPETDTA